MFVLFERTLKIMKNSNLQLNGYLTKPLDITEKLHVSILQH